MCAYPEDPRHHCLSTGVTFEANIHTPYYSFANFVLCLVSGRYSAVVLFYFISFYFL